MLINNWAILHCRSKYHCTGIHGGLSVLHGGEKLNIAADLSNIMEIVSSVKKSLDLKDRSPNQKNLFVTIQVVVISER